MRQPHRDISSLCQILNLPPSLRFTEKRLSSDSSLSCELHRRFFLALPGCRRRPALGPEEEAGKLDAHVSLGVDDPDPLLFKQATRLLGGCAGNQEEMGALRQVLSVLDELAGGGGVRQPLGLDFDDVGDVSGTDHDVLSALGGARGRGRHSWDLMEEPEHGFLQGPLDIH